MKRDETVIPINWFWPVFFFSASLLLLLLPENTSNSAFIKSRTTATIVVSFMAGIVSLNSYVINKEGIITRLAGTPRRTILWETVTEVKVVPDDKSFCVLFILESCPKPNYANREEYNFRFAKKHPDHILILDNARKNIGAVEKYYPGEIVGKELLVEKQK